MDGESYLFQTLKQLKQLTAKFTDKAAGVDHQMRRSLQLFVCRKGNCQNFLEFKPSFCQFVVKTLQVLTMANCVEFFDVVLLAFSIILPNLV
jgi:hypothetical protein